MDERETLLAKHALEAEKAKQIYVQSRTAERDASDWHTALRFARKQVTDALRASNYLTDIAAALRTNGANMLVFRQLMAPPISQDQFSLLCPPWRKNTEKTGAGLRRDEADYVAAVWNERRSRALTSWLDIDRRPFSREIRRLVWTIGPLIASQQAQTLQRNRAAAVQETTVTALLRSRGWHQKPSSLLDTRAALPQRHFMHKTRFATATTTPQEVDIAMGLGGTVVLAMECKVSNDATNSVKRINDVLKKSAAWKKHWGSFVKTAALLQGVIAAKDVYRLIDEGVEVFWSHNIEELMDWLDTNY